MVEIKFRKFLLEKHGPGVWEKTALARFMAHKEARDLLDMGMCIAGGSVRDAVLGKPDVKDIDIFFVNEYDFDEAEEYLNEHPEARRGYESEFAVTWWLKLGEEKFEVQLVKFDTHVCTSVSDLLKNFDFTCCQFAYTTGGYLLYFEDSLKHLESKELYLNSMEFPLMTFRRLLKFQKYGYSVPDRTMVDVMYLAAKMEKEHPGICTRGGGMYGNEGEPELGIPS